MFDSDRQDLYMGLEVGGYSLFAYTSGYVGRIVLRLVFREPPREHSWTVHGLSCSELFLVSLGHGLLWRSWWVVYVGEGTYGRTRERGYDMKAVNCEGWSGRR